MLPPLACIPSLKRHDAVYMRGVGPGSRAQTAFLRLFISPSPPRLPPPPPQERKRLLSFVIVGGGPTGVEVAAELHDLITEDLVKLYPEEVRYRFCTPLPRAGSLATLMPRCKPVQTLRGGGGGGCPVTSG
jgi:hypothetical protein